MPFRSAAANLSSLEEITALILAGGRSTRMGGHDKGLIELGGRPLVDHVIYRMRGQVSQIVISANRNCDRYREFGYPVVSDEQNEYLGPLAGILSGLRTAPTEWIVVVPCDAPLVSMSLVTRLRTHASDKNTYIAVAHDGIRLQPTFSLLHRSLASDIERSLKTQTRAITSWFERHHTAVVDFQDHIESFTNINDPHELQLLEDRLRTANQC